MGALFITVHDQDGDAAESSLRCGEMGKLAARYLKLESQMSLIWTTTTTTNCVEGPLLYIICIILALTVLIFMNWGMALRIIVAQRGLKVLVTQTENVFVLGFFFF